MLSTDLPTVRCLHSLLVDLEYDAVQRTLRPHYFAWPFPPLEVFRKLLLYLPERQRVSYEVLLLGQPVRRARLVALWGTGVVEDLTSLGLLIPDASDRVRTDNYSIVSYLGRYFAVSINPYYPTSRDPDASVYIGPDSLTLAASLPVSREVERCLDLCTGSGIQAILMAATAKRVVAVEINEQAANVARFNAALNCVADRVDVLCGDLYDVVPEGTYDLIVSNPPFLPVPAGVHHAVPGHGGLDGLVVLRPLLDGIPARLAHDGEALVYAEGVGDAEGPFVRRLLEEMAHKEKMDIRTMLVSRLTIKNTLVLKATSLAHLRRPSSELVQWRDLYQQLGATHSYNYLLRLRRGEGHVSQIAAFDPHREERGIELPSGTLIKTR
jgi:methylase of polypeptide subunit release factors